ncbi:hypothetical protein [Nocardioides cynanchi]|uniref:hypothetical protein n=1 Tax=Nocardioides cynanchi TaxID=2558918 RepID=UPI0012444191|nr:hypothetical protein [Nocardioides cynanchi]
MRPRLALIPAALLLVGCGSHQPVAYVAHPTGHRDVVLRLTTGPGMGTVETFFSEPPVLVVTGDGTSYLRGEEVTAHGIVWPVFRFRAGDAEVQSLLQEADRDGLLAPSPDYSPPSPIMDGGDTTVAVSAANGTWTHRANGLDDAALESGARGRLAGFVAYLDRWGRTPRRPRAQELRPTTLRVLAQPSDGAGTPVAAWPSGTGVPLDRIGDCTVVRDPVVVRRLTTSDTHYYRDAGRTYQVAAAVLLPGDSCPAGGAS